MPKKNKRKNRRKQVPPILRLKSEKPKPKATRQRKPNVTIELLEQRAERMRQNPTPSEALFATRLLDAGIAFRGQFVLGNYIVDFLVGCLVVEIDGAIHSKSEQKKYDTRRDAFIRRMGYQILRIPNENVFEFDLERIRNAPPLSAKQQGNLCRRERRMLARLGQTSETLTESSRPPRLIKQVH